MFTKNTITVLCYVSLCVASVALLTFCGKNGNNGEQGNTASPSPSPSPSPTTTTGAETDTKAIHRFKPAEITAGVPFSFEMTWLGEQYDLSLHDCGPDALLLQGMWPSTMSATAAIRGQDDEVLEGLVIINSKGKPTIPASCHLQASAGEESTLIALEVKTGKITLSDVDMQDRTVSLTAKGVAAEQNSGIAIARREEERYVMVAISKPLTYRVQNGRVDGITLYQPPKKLDLLSLRDLQEIENFAAGEYLINIANYRINMSSMNIEFQQVSAIKVSKPTSSLTFSESFLHRGLTTKSQ